jgi:hypothetical protein
MTPDPARIAADQAAQLPGKRAEDDAWVGDDLVDPLAASEALGYRRGWDAGTRSTAAKVQALHRKASLGAELFCLWDGEPWPCKTIRVLDGEAPDD